MDGLTREMKKEEAVRRMRALGIHKNAIRDFDKEDQLNMSVDGFLFWLNDDQKKRIADFEEKYDVVAYHVIETKTQFGLLHSVLYVSAHPEEWERDRIDIDFGNPMAYVINLDYDWCSEFGFICVAERYGGLVRTS